MVLHTNNGIIHFYYSPYLVLCGFQLFPKFRLRFQRQTYIHYLFQGLRQPLKQLQVRKRKLKGTKFGLHTITVLEVYIQLSHLILQCFILHHCSSGLLNSRHEQKIHNKTLQYSRQSDFL